MWTIDGRTGSKFPPAAPPGFPVLSYWHDKGADGTPAPYLPIARTWLGPTCLQLERPANGATESDAAEALEAGCRDGFFAGWQPNCTAGVFRRGSAVYADGMAEAKAIFLKLCMVSADLMLRVHGKAALTEHFSFSF